LLAKKILVGLILILFFAFAALGKDSVNTSEPVFLDDRSDVTQTLSANSFQIQAGISYSQTKLNDTSSNQISVPSIIARYGITDNFGIQVKSEFDLNETSANGNIINENDQLGYILFGLLYQVSQEKRILFFDQLSFLLDCTIPLTSMYYFSTEVDMVLATNFSNRFSIEYGIGYRYHNSTDDFLNFLFQLDVYITRNINCTIFFNRSRIFELDSQSIQNMVGVELDFLTMQNYQFELVYTLGIREDYWFLGGVFVYTL